MQKGFFYDFSNYGVYERLGDDGLTTWHPAFLALGEDLEECARKYRNFCYQYKPQEKKGKGFYWGSKLLPKLTRKKKSTKSKNQQKKQPKKVNEEAQQQYEIWRENNPEIIEVAEKFIFANCYNRRHVAEFLHNYEYY
jgi:putative transposase